MTIQIRFFRVVSPALTLLALGAPALGALDRDRVPVGSVPAGISSAKRLGPAEAQLPVERVLISLRQRNPEALARFLEAQQDPASPQFHRWLTPEEFGDRFGAAREDVEALTGWLAEQGLVVESVSKGRIAVAVSGTVERMEAAFGTKLAAYAAADRLVLANEEPPTLPSRFARSVSGVVSLHGFTKRKPLLHESPLYTNGTGRYSLAPADLHVIYGFTSLLTKGIDGAGTKIAVPSRSNVNPEAFRAFRAAFALPANDPVVLLNGPDPGILSGAEEGFAQEAALDVEWCGAAAPKATIVFVLAASTSTADGIDLASLYAVDQNAADVVELSYGFCELDKDGGPEATAFYHAIWAQAAAQGMSVVVASGDSGAAGCDLGSATGTIASVNGLGSSPYATCVGGTTFAEGGTPSAYWDATNDAGTGRSAKSYIPEIVWNESSLNGGRGLLATGGGVSAIFSKPSWQSGPGVPNDAVRDVPDVAMNAASHTPYLTFYGRTTPFQTAFYGTSASAPPFAGLAALLVQKAGGRVGNLNPALYAIARGAASGSSPFHDVTMGNNTVTGVPGFPATAGFDLSTGLGSPDAGKLASAFTAPPAAPDFEIIASPGSFGLLPGQSRDVSVRLEGAAGDVTAFLSLDGVPAGLTASFSPSPVSAAGGKGVASNGFPATLTLRASNSASPGIYTIAISATAGAATRSTVLVLSIGTTTPPVTSGVEVQIPVVLDVHGAGTSHFTSDLTVQNRTGVNITARVRFAAAPDAAGTGGPVLARSLGAGRQFYVTDVVAWLRTNGYAFPNDASSKLGTLFVSFDGVSDPNFVYAGSRVSTANPNTSVGGSFGLYTNAVRSGTSSSGEAWVYGLRESAAYRSNLAVVHAPAAASSLQSGSGPIEIEIDVVSGDTGFTVGSPIRRTLQPGEFFQVNGILATAGVTNGYARVRRVSGTDGFIAYGVVNDGGTSAGTSDGSFLPSGGSEGLVPIVLDLPGATHYQTDLSLTNPGTSQTNVSLGYIPSKAIAGATGGGTVTISLGAGRQLLIPNAIAYLRSLGLPIPDDGSKQGGALVVQGAIAIARTFNPNPDTTVGGTFGVAYPAVGPSSRAVREAFVYGLRQDADVRSNLAIVDARFGLSSPLDYTVDVYDADTGSAKPAGTRIVPLTGGDWIQLDSILAAYGVAHGYVRVRPATETSDFVVYGVVNDGPVPGSRTSDGSYLPMVVP